MADEEKEKVKGGCARADKWLWATRMFRTRSQAGVACRRGQVVLDETEVKASRVLKLGDTLKVKRDELMRTVEVVGIPRSRVPAKLVGEYMTDLTTEEEIERAREEREKKAANKVFRIPGEGRPTKKQLREIQKYVELERGDGG